MSCPNCGQPAIGSTCVRMHTRGTEIPIDAAICSECLTVFIPPEELEEYQDRAEARIDHELAHRGEPTLKDYQ